MADTGWVSPGTVVNDDAIGDWMWCSVNNAKENDDIPVDGYDYGSGEDSNYLKATNFGLEVPSGATINGILVEIRHEGYSDYSNNTENIVSIVKHDGSIGSTNQSTNAVLPVDYTYISYGSSSDLWGETWSATDINDEDFGVVFSVSFSNSYNGAFVDHIQIKVYYTESTDTPVIGNKYPLPAFKNIT